MENELNAILEELVNETTSLKAQPEMFELLVGTLKKNTAQTVLDAEDLVKSVGILNRMVANNSISAYQHGVLSDIVAASFRKNSVEHRTYAELVRLTKLLESPDQSLSDDQVNMLFSLLKEKMPSSGGFTAVSLPSLLRLICDYHWQLLALFVIVIGMLFHIAMFEKFASVSRSFDAARNGHFEVTFCTLVILVFILVAIFSRRWLVRSPDPRLQETLQKPQTCPRQFSLKNAASRENRISFTTRPSVSCEALCQLEDKVSELERRLIEHSRLAFNSAINPKNRKENLLMCAIISAPRQGKTLFLDKLLSGPSFCGVVEITCNSKDPVEETDKKSAAAAYRAVLLRVINALVGGGYKMDELEGVEVEKIEGDIRRHWAQKISAADPESEEQFVPCLLIDELTVLIDDLSTKEGFTFWANLRRLLEPLQREVGGQKRWFQLSLVYTGFTHKSQRMQTASGMSPFHVYLPRYAPDDLDNMLKALLKKYQQDWKRSYFPSILWELSKRSAGLLGHQLYEDASFADLDRFIQSMMSDWPKVLHKKAESIWPHLRQYIILGPATPADVFNELGNWDCMSEHDGKNWTNPSPFACAVVVRTCWLGNAFPGDEVLRLTHEALEFACEKKVDFKSKPWETDKPMPTDWCEDGHSFEEFILKAFELRHHIAVENKETLSMRSQLHVCPETTLATWRPKTSVSNLFFSLSCVSERNDLKTMLGDFHYHLFPEGALPLLRKSKRDSASRVVFSIPDLSVDISIVDHSNPAMLKMPSSSLLRWGVQKVKSFPIAKGNELNAILRTMKDGRHGGGFVIKPEARKLVPESGKPGCGNGDNPGCEFAVVTYDKQGCELSETTLNVVLVEAKDCRTLESTDASKKVSICFVDPLSYLWVELAKLFKEVHVGLVVIGRFTEPPIAKTNEK